MARTRIDEAGGLRVADVVHVRFSTLPAAATVGEVRDWFAASTSRRLALLADDGRYAGSVLPEHVAGEGDRERPVAEVAVDGPTVLPEDSADHGQRVALRTDARRVPVVDCDGRLVGVLAVTTDLEAFCGTGGDGGGRTA